jgi:NTP pyrophosphatase (non-canonical NTP hydrolase)
MNLNKWERPEVPLEILALKLCEEAGEVAKELADGWKRGGVDRGKLIEELNHVVALAKVLQERCDEAPALTEVR